MASLVGGRPLRTSLSEVFVTIKVPPDISIASIASMLISAPVFEPEVEDDAPIPAQSEAKPKRQITPPSNEELAELQELAAEVGELADEIATRVGSLGHELQAKKKLLLTKLLGHGLTEVRVEGRPVIKVTTDKKKDTTKKTITAVFGASEGSAIWNKLPYKESEGLSVPTRDQGDGPTE